MTLQPNDPTETRPTLPGAPYMRVAIGNELLSDIANTDIELSHAALVGAARRRGYDPEDASTLASFVMARFRPAKGRRNDR